MSTNLPLPQFYARTLRTLLPVMDGTTPFSESSGPLKSSLDDLYLMGRMLSSLGVFSTNEKADELGDRELVFTTVGWVLGEAEARNGSSPSERKGALERSDTAFNAFIALLEAYGLANGSGEENRRIPADPAARRDAKIAAFKRTKEVREKISQALPGIEASANPIEFILALLDDKDKTTSVSVNDEEPETRKATLNLLTLLHELTITSLSNNAMELELLRHAPESTEGPLQDPREVRREEDDTWRLDRKPTSYKPKELISGGGRVLRPFTILPSTAAMSDKSRLQSEVFRSSHRLPTMTIDEYLAEEDARGNIIRGGGQASYDAPTESELLELEAENDGAKGAEEAEEKKRLKEENWARFTDENRKGEGNTTNRG